MPKRRTVELNIPFVLPRIREKCRNNTVFAEKMGRPKQPGWVSGWTRSTGTKNLPSPEEAAKMCELLEATPEEILVNQDDIDLVTAIFAERQTETPAAQGDRRLRAKIEQLTPENQLAFEKILEILIKNPELIQPTLGILEVKSKTSP